VHTDLRAAVARVSRLDGKDWGTAFFVEPGNRLVSCTHVVASAADAQGLVAIDLQPPGEDGVAAESVRHWARWLRDDSSDSRAADISLLELTGTPPGWVRALRIVADPPPYIGQKIVSHGFSNVRPRFGDPAVGTVLGMTSDPDTNCEVIEIRSAELTGGYSGAPIVDLEEGHVIGVVVATLRPDARDRFGEHAWAIPAAVLGKVSSRITLASHPLLEELARVAISRRPLLLDFAIPGGEHSVVMPARFRTVAEKTSILELSDVLRSLAGAPYKVAAISGVSGSGKSTFLRAVLGKELAERKRVEAGIRVPLYVKASALVNVVGGSCIGQLCNAVARDSSIRFATASIVPVLERLLVNSNHRFAVLLDGLDEITNPLLRAEIARNLADLGEQLSSRGHLMIIASRPVDELRQLSTPQNKVLELQMEPTSDSDRKEFFAQILGEAASEFSKQYDRIHGIGAQGSPLLATLAISIFLRNRALPRSVVELFRRFVELLVQRAFGGMGAMNPADSEELLDAVQALAFCSLSAEELTIEESIEFLRGEISKGQAPPISRLAQRQTAVAQLDVVLGAQLGIYREEQSLTWTHLSIRDYFAGAYIAERFVDQKQWNKAAANWRKSSWQGAVLFATLIRASDDQLTPEMLSSIPPFNNSAPDDEAISFLCNLLELQEARDNALIKDVVDASVICGIQSFEDYNSCSRVFSSNEHPLECLVRLQNITPFARDRILEIANMETLPAKIRILLAGKIAET